MEFLTFTITNNDIRFLIHLDTLLSFHIIITNNSKIKRYKKIVNSELVSNDLIQYIKKKKCEIHQ